MKVLNLESNREFYSVAYGFANGELRFGVRNLKKMMRKVGFAENTNREFGGEGEDGEERR